MLVTKSGKKSEKEKVIKMIFNSLVQNGKCNLLTLAMTLDDTKENKIRKKKDGNGKLGSVKIINIANQIISCMD